MFLTVLNNFSCYMNNKRLEPHSVFVSSLNIAIRAVNKGRNLHISTVIPEQA